jgi:hypothetical protein
VIAGRSLTRRGPQAPIAAEARLAPLSSTSFTVLSRQLHYGLSGARSATTAITVCATIFRWLKQGGWGMLNREVGWKSGYGRIAVARSGRLSRITLGTRARKRLALAVPLVFLTACTQTPQVRYVSTPCLTQLQLDQIKSQEPPKVHDQLTGDASHDVGPLAGSAIRLRAWGEGLITVLSGCTEATAKPQSAGN